MAVQFDAVVVGAGPAGFAAALTMAKNNLSKTTVLPPTTPAALNV
jgi:flavin-dependent dehydrogenase